MYKQILSMIYKLIHRHSQNQQYVSRQELEQWMKIEGVDYGDVFPRK